MPTDPPIRDHGRPQVAPTAVHQEASLATEHKKKTVLRRNNGTHRTIIKNMEKQDLRIANQRIGR